MPNTGVYAQNQLTVSWPDCRTYFVGVYFFIFVYVYQGGSKETFSVCSDAVKMSFELTGGVLLFDFLYK